MKFYATPNRPTCSKILLTLLLLLAPVQCVLSQSVPWHIQAITTEEITSDSLAIDSPPLVVAVVDDGALINHTLIRPFLWHNPGEILANGIDDDGNGYIDDTHGWDAADEDNDVTPPLQRRQEYDHGTHVTGLVIQVATAALGPDAARHVKIMPVKTLSDGAVNLQLQSAYKGLRYAIDAGADIILCAWSVGQLSLEEKHLLDEAHSAGILIVASVGNLLNEVTQYPAAHPNVLAIAATNRSNGALPESNYGQFVDMTAPGEGILSLGMSAETPESEKTGSSFAAALVAASAALVKLAHPMLTPLEIKACLVNHTDPFNELPVELAGKLGAGRLNVTKAIRCDSLFDKNFIPQANRSHGYVVAHGDRPRWNWSLEPEGRFKAVRLVLHATEATANASVALEYKVGNPKGKSATEDYKDQFSLGPASDSAATISLLVPSKANIQLSLHSLFKDTRLLIEYRAETIDFTKAHCEGKITITTEGMISDGSGAHDYAYNTDCQWQVIAPEGKRVQFDFSHMTTEPNHDSVYFFNGDRTNAPVMAVLSGNTIPPTLISRSNKVLVWFLSDRKNQHGGWEARISFVD